MQACARGVLRLYASDAAFSVGVRLALLLLLSLWLVALSLQCVPTTARDGTEVPRPCPVGDPWCA
jgi:hypothetical protein